MIAIDTLPWKDFITLGAAALGAGLGIMNTWQAISTRQVRLRVRPAHAFSATSHERMFTIEVVNLSNFALTIEEVGFTIGRNVVRKGTRAAVLQPIIIDGKSWPRRLEAREAVSVYFYPPDVSDPIGKAYARTTCGEVGYGDSPALRQIRTEQKRRR